MKVRVEYKKDGHTGEWLFGFVRQHLGKFSGGKEGLETFNTHAKTLNGAFRNFNKYLVGAYPVKIRSVEVLQRISKTIPIGIGEIRIDDSEGSN